MNTKNENIDLLHDLRKKVFGSAGGMLVLNLCNQALLLLIIVLLTRALGAEEFGIYAVLISILTLLAIPLSAGFPLFMVRQVSANMAAQNHACAKGVIYTGFFYIFALSLLAVFGSYIAYFFFPALFPAPFQMLFFTGLVILPLSGFLLFFGSILRGLQKPVIGRFSDFMVQPLVFCLLVFTLFFAFQDFTKDAVHAVYFYIISFAVALIVCKILFFIYLPADLKRAKPSYDFKAWAKSLFPLLFASGMTVVNLNIDIVMVGALAGTEEAGQYRVATRLASFIPFFLVAANNAMSPRIAGLYTAGDKEKLQSLIKSISRAVFLLTLPVFLIAMIFPQTLIGLLFGPDFMAAVFPFMVLVGAQFFGVFMGQVGQVLAMTGHERYAAFSVMFAVLVNVALNFLLVPVFGILGAAIATGVSIAGWNIVLGFWTYRKTGLRCAAF